MRGWLFLGDGKRNTSYDVLDTDYVLRSAVVSVRLAMPPSIRGPSCRAPVLRTSVGRSTSVAAHESAGRRAITSASGLSVSVLERPPEIPARDRRVWPPLLAHAEHVLRRRPLL